MEIQNSLFSTGHLTVDIHYSSFLTLGTLGTPNFSSLIPLTAHHLPFT